MINLVEKRLMSPLKYAKIKIEKVSAKELILLNCGAGKNS